MTRFLRAWPPPGIKKFLPDVNKKQSGNVKNIIRGRNGPKIIFTFLCGYVIFNQTCIRRVWKMKKFLLLSVVLSIAFVSSIMAFGELTAKVDNLISTNQANLERTYYPRDSRPNELLLTFGPPFCTGLEYSYNVMPALAIDAGIGNTYPGLSAGLGVIYYILPTTFAPYVKGGIMYYGNFTENIDAATIGAGVDVALDNSMVIRLGLDWVKSLSNAGAPFQTIVYNGDINWFNISCGVGFRF